VRGGGKIKLFNNQLELQFWPKWIKPITRKHHWLFSSIHQHEAAEDVDSKKSKDTNHLIVASFFGIAD